MDDDQRLLDLGERKIVSEILPTYVTGVGDDCTNFSLQDQFIVATTDPVPIPAAEAIGGDSDPYWKGWLLVTINASDIAAAGAAPQIFLAAFDIPANWTVRELKRLLAGVKDSCEANGLQYAGGNIREAAKFSAVGTAIGACGELPLSRKGATNGSRLVVVGDAGRFWSDVIDLKEGITLDKTKSPVFRPVSLSSLMHRIPTNFRPLCSMDTSDGLAPALEELVRQNGVGISLSSQQIQAASSSLTKAERAERLWMGWGDWTIVAAFDPDNVDEFLEFAASEGVAATLIGEFTDNFTEVRINDSCRAIRLARLESERFSADSWFTVGISAYEEALRSLPLP